MKYVCLLRGVNVSGKNKISVSELRKLLESNNFKNVSTYLNSGNIIFESEIIDKDILMKDIRNIICDYFNLSVPFIIISLNELEDILDNNPSWWGSSDKNIYDNIIFVIPPFKPSDVFNSVGSPSEGIDIVLEYKSVIFWSFDLKKYRKSNWWVKTASLPIKDSITIRTGNTIKKILNICHSK